LITSNIFISPAFAEKSHDTSTDKDVYLYSPDSTDEIILYEDDTLENELVSIQNNHPAQLLKETESADTSLVEVKTAENEVVQGYIQSELVISNQDMLDEYKLYTKEAGEDIQVYIDEEFEQPLYELKEGTSVLVNKIDLEATEDYVEIMLNPETEEVPETLKERFEQVEDIEGFVHRDHLVDLKDEEVLLSEREDESEEPEKE